MNTHGLICDFGTHAGTPYTQIPVSYLRWMVNVNHRLKNIAQAELDRRGTVLPTLELSGHAIDRASLFCRKQWRETALNGEEGLHAWLLRVSREALDNGVRDKKGNIHHIGLKFVFQEDGVWPVLKTVINNNRGSHEAG